jgi:hypothetical protein
MDKNNKDKWINDTIESINGVKKAEASPFLYAKVLNKIKSGNRSRVIPVKKAALGFITMLLLAVLNIAIALNYNSKNNYIESNNNSAQELVPSQTNPFLEYLK